MAAALPRAVAPVAAPTAVVAPAPVNLWLGTSVWLPGQVAPFMLYGSTADGSLHYSAPDGFEVVVLRWLVGYNSVAQSVTMSSLSGLGQ